VNLDVQQFKPEEIAVKTVDSEGSSCIVVEGKHEEKQDEHGFVTRHFVRRYMLPADADGEKIQCKLSSDGILDVSVPKKVNRLNLKKKKKMMKFLKYTIYHLIADMMQSMNLARVSSSWCFVVTGAASSRV
jgi:HSP20 family molecular chaperone IbpA